MEASCSWGNLVNLLALPCSVDAERPFTAHQGLLLGRTSVRAAEAVRHPRAMGDRSQAQDMWVSGFGHSCTKRFI
jgi:hypothetical protein